MNAVFAGTVNGGTSITKTGPGTQTFSGIVDPSSPSNVNEGTLNITGSFTGDINVNGNGTLAGSGTVIGAVVNAGTFYPTGSRFTVSSFTNGANGTYEASIGKSDTSYQTVVTGDTTLHGDIFVEPINDAYTFHSPNVVLTSDSTISGTFASVTSSSPLVIPFVTYDARHVYVSVSQNTKAAAKNGSQKGVATQLDGILSPNASETDLLNEIVTISIGDASKALQSLAATQYADENFFVQSVNRQFLRRLYDPLRSIVTCNDCKADDCNDWTVWFESGADVNRLNGSRAKGYQLTTGVQKQFCPEWTVGMAVSYEGNIIHYKNEGGFGHVDTGLIGVYSLYRPDRFYMLSDIGYGYSAHTLHRNIVIGSAVTQARGTPRTSAATFYSEIGADWDMHHILVQPFLGVEVDGSWRGELKESGPSAEKLILRRNRHTDAYSRLGLHLTGCKIPHNFLVSADIAWGYRFTSQNNLSKERFAGFGDSFTVQGTKLNRSSLDYALTLANQIDCKRSVYVETTGEIYNKAATYTVLVGFGFSK